MEYYRRTEDTELKNKTNLDLLRIVENRVLPGLLFLDKDGEIIFCNPLAHHSLGEKKYRDWIIEQFKNDDTPAGLAVNTVIHTQDRYYGIRAFRLSNESQVREPAIIAVLIEEISTNRLDNITLNGSDSFHFSPRETEVINALQLGMTDKMIAAKLQISPETVHGYVKSIRAKLGVSTRTAILHKLYAH